MHVRQESRRDGSRVEVASHWAGVFAEATELQEGGLAQQPKV